MEQIVNPNLANTHIVGYSITMLLKCVLNHCALHYHIKASNIGGNEVCLLRSSKKAMICHVIIQEIEIKIST